MRFHHHPWHELRGLKQNLGDLFEEILGKEPFDKGEIWKPFIDLIELDEEFIVSAEIPGMEKKDIKVNFNESTLELSGERKRFTEEKRYFRSECYYGPFNRSIKIPGEIEQNNITANYQNGILLIHLPKKQDSTSNEIKIDIS
jgi:HSP20 family protein